MHRIFVPELQHLSEPIALSAEEARHAVQVMRLKEGDDVGLINGNGKAAQGAIQHISKKNVTVLAKEWLEPCLGWSHLVVAAAPPKGNRLEGMVRALTELGVGTYIPLITEFGQRQPRGDRLSKVVIEACKQSGRCDLMRIQQPMKLTDALTSYAKAQWVLLDPYQDSSLSLSEFHQGICLAIGPEGGFSPTESRLLQQAGALSMRLASPVLRIETAAVAAAGVMSRGLLTV